MKDLNQILRKIIKNDEYGILKRVPQKFNVV